MVHNNLFRSSHLEGKMETWKLLVASYTVLPSPMGGGGGRCLHLSTFDSLPSDFGCAKWRYMAKCFIRRRLSSLEVASIFEVI